MREEGLAGVAGRERNKKSTYGLGRHSRIGSKVSSHLYHDINNLNLKGGLRKPETGSAMTGMSPENAGKQDT